MFCVRTITKRVKFISFVAHKSDQKYVIEQIKTPKYKNHFVFGLYNLSESPASVKLNSGISEKFCRRLTFC